MDHLKELNELALGSRLKRMSDTIMREVMIIYEKSGIDFEPTLMPTFNYLQKHAPAGITQISQALGISQPAVSQFTAQLNTKGYTKLTVGKTDTRKRMVQLTPKGKQLSEQLKPIWLLIEQEVKNLMNQQNSNLLNALNDFETNFIGYAFADRVISKIQNKKSDVSITEYNEKYKNDIKRLNYEWLEKYFSVEPGDKASLANPKKEIIDKGGHVFYAMCENEVVGTVSLLKLSEGEFELGKMAVTEKFKGKKIGQKLMEHCIAQAKKKKIKKLILYSNTKLAPAINLYIKYGFKVAPIDANFPYKRSNIKMELNLN